MDKSRLTAKATRVLELAHKYNSENPEASPEESLLAGSIFEATGLAAKALTAASITSNSLRNRTATVELDTSQKSHDLDGYMDIALDEALKLAHNFVGTEHILLAITGTDEGKSYLRNRDIDANSLRATVLRLMGQPYVDVGVPYPLARNV